MLEFFVRHATANVGRGETGAETGEGFLLFLLIIFGIVIYQGFQENIQAGMIRLVSIVGFLLAYYYFPKEFSVVAVVLVGWFVIYELINFVKRHL